MERDWKKSHHSGHRAEGLCSRLPRSLPNLGGLAGRFDRIAGKTLPARLRRYASPDLLIIDEFGFDRIERVECPEAAHLLYKIIAARNQKRSTAVVTNVDFEKWGEYLTDGPLAMAFLDRFRRHRQDDAANPGGRGSNACLRQARRTGAA
jgi:hypothetical protein